MNGGRMVAVRFLPFLLAFILLAAWMADVREGAPYLLRNLLPGIVWLALVAWALWHNAGTFFTPDSKRTLGALGFAIPAVGLSVYLHAAFQMQDSELFGPGSRPDRLFRYLPIYTLVAGGLGFAIGWIIGRNVNRD